MNEVLWSRLLCVTMTPLGVPIEPEVYCNKATVLPLTSGSDQLPATSSGAEGTTLGVLAWICAVFLGIPAAYGLNIVQAHLLAPVPFAFDELDLVWMFIAIMILAALASIGPVLAAARIKIVQILQYE